MKKTLLFIPALILIISCTADDDTADYHPLAVGYSWEYDVIQTDSQTQTAVQISTITAEVVSSHGTLFEQVTSTDWEDTSTTAWLDTSYLQERGGNVLFYNDINDSEPDTLLVLPLVLGNTWTVRIEPWGSMTGEVLGLEDLAVPAGTFTECWRIQYTGLDDTGYSWFAPDVGLIKHEAAGPTTAFSKELTDFSTQ
ncbi:MAG: hypothetical protein JSW49_04560 [candidate division WOR-3 bacterium]|nr:MAG: hypothetical protein JSW49_04560 [candidate division WOR-3 bacterium]